MRRSKLIILAMCSLLPCLAACPRSPANETDGGSDDRTGGKRRSADTNVEPPDGTALLPMEELESLRDPFWPVGWAPRADVPSSANRGPAPSGGLLQWQAAASNIRLSGLSKTVDGDYLAMLKGIGVVEEGDTISIEHEGFVYRWRIVAITEKGILPKQLNAYPAE